MRRRIAHLALAAAGIGLLVWGIVLAASPTASCRNRVMGPGDTCHYAGLLGPDFSRTQTYEQRIATIRSNAPVLMGLGVVVVVFGGALLLQEIRRGAGRLPRTRVSHTGSEVIGVNVTTRLPSSRQG